MDTYEIRRHNLQALMDREYGAGVRGAKSALAKRLDKQPDYISRCLYPPEKPGRKNIGEEFARQIEVAYGLDKYAFDKEEPATGVSDARGRYTVKRNYESHQAYVYQKDNLKPPVKTDGFWMMDLVLQKIKSEDPELRKKMRKATRNEISHGVESRKQDRHRVQRLLYIIGGAAIDGHLGDSEIMMLEAAVVCVDAKYEMIEAQETIDKKLRELDAMEKQFL